MQHLQDSQQLSPSDCTLQAHAQLLDPANYEGIESELTFLGVAGLLDPPRPEVKGAIEDCVLAGIRVRSQLAVHGMSLILPCSDVLMLVQMPLQCTGTLEALLPHA